MPLNCAWWTIRLEDFLSMGHLVFRLQDGYQKAADGWARYRSSGRRPKKRHNMETWIHFIYLIEYLQRSKKRYEKYSSHNQEKITEIGKNKYFSPALCVRFFVNATLHIRKMRCVKCRALVPSAGQITKKKSQTFRNFFGNFQGNHQTLPCKFNYALNTVMSTRLRKWPI